MINAFEEPLTPGRWLARSLSWVTVGGLVLQLINAAIFKVLGWLNLDGSHRMLMLWLLAGNFVALIMIWRRASADGAAALAHSPPHGEPAWVRVVATAWRLVLLLLLLCELGGLLLFAGAVFLDEYYPSPPSLGDPF